MIRFSALIGLTALAGCTLNTHGELGPEQGNPDASSEAGTAGAGGLAGSAGSAGKGGSAGGAAGGAAGADSSGGSGGMAGEDCLNGADDDGDGKTDCEDDDCIAGYQCVDPVPEGWEGYVRILSGPYDAAAPVLDCPWGSSAARYYAEPDNTPSCDPCTCGTPTGFTCAPPHIRCSPDETDCSNEKTPGWDGTSSCTTIPTNFSSEHVVTCHLTASTEVLAKGNCLPSHATYSNYALWKSVADLCAHPHGTGCAAGSCVLKPSAPYNGPVCIRHQDAATCPAGWPVSYTVYSGGIDERVCSTCNCDPGVVTCSGGIYTFYDANACAKCDPNTGCTSEVLVGPGTGCMDLTDTADGNDFSVQITKPALPTQCAASGGQPSGQIHTLGQTTLCCKAE